MDMMRELKVDLGYGLRGVGVREGMKFQDQTTTL